MSPETTFTRLVLAAVIGDVRAKIPGVRVSEAWVYCLDDHHWEFHYRDFYWHGGASDAYDARANGWLKYLDSIGRGE